MYTNEKIDLLIDYLFTKPILKVAGDREREGRDGQAGRQAGVSTQSPEPAGPRATVTITAVRRPLPHTLTRSLNTRFHIRTQTHRHTHALSHPVFARKLPCSLTLCDMRSCALYLSCGGASAASSPTWWGRAHST